MHKNKRFTLQNQHIFLEMIGMTFSSELANSFNQQETLLDPQNQNWRKF